MLSIHFPIDALTQLSQKTRERMLSERPELIRRLGGRLQSLAMESLEKRSRGQSDIGITWEHLTERYLKSKRRRGLSDKIGVATGKLFQSGELVEEAGSVHLEFSADYAFRFSQLRPLLPLELPPDWQEKLEQEAIEWADDILVEHFEDEVPF